jgi:WhiB family redox-sensing transcriptional regulator
MAAERWEYGWQWRGACRGRDANLFFPPSHLERAELKRERERAAKAICAGCPVRIECLDYSLRTREPYGVWGGLNEMERRRVLRDRDTSSESAGPR